jgi:hypothetical protein
MPAIQIMVRGDMYMDIVEVSVAASFAISSISIAGVPVKTAGAGIYAVSAVVARLSMSTPV